MTFLAKDANGTNVATGSESIAGEQHQTVIIEQGELGAVTRISSTNPLPVNVNNMPAADRTVDSIAAALQTGALMNGNVPLTPKFAKIAVAASGTIVAAVAGKKIRVIAWDLVCNGAVNAKWQSHVTPTDLTGLYYFSANDGIAKSFSPFGYFETVAGEALDLNLSAAIAVGGSLVYVEV